MPNVNQMVVVGHLGQDPKVLADGRLLTFSVATTKKWRGKDGEWKEKTTWIQVKWWSDKFAAMVGAALRRGSVVTVIGSFATEKYTAKDGTEKTQSYCAAEFVVPGEWPSGDRQARGRTEPARQERDSSLDDLFGDPFDDGNG